MLKLINRGKAMLMTLLLATAAYAQDVSHETDSLSATNLNEVVVTGGKSRMTKVTNTELIGRNELVRAACCNLAIRRFASFRPKSLENSEILPFMLEGRISPTIK